MKVSEVMTTEVETVSADQTAREAAAFMLRADAGSIPVCEGERVIVVINRGDVIERLVLPVQAERTEVLWGQAQVGLDGGGLLLRVDAQSGVVVRV